MPHSADTGTPMIPQDSRRPLASPSDAMSTRDSAAILSGKRLWRRWFALVTLGELLGFLTPSVVGALVVDRVDVLAAAALLVAGGVEGVTLGWFQARALRPALPGLSSARWVAATALGAVVAWAVGALFVVTDGLSGWGGLGQVAGFATGGLVILLSIGVAQWVVLREHADRAARWIPANVVAWLAGLTAFTAFTSPLWQPGQAVAVVALIGVVGGMLMAAAMAAVTGGFLVGLVGKSER